MHSINIEKLKPAITHSDFIVELHPETILIVANFVDWEIFEPSTFTASHTSTHTSKKREGVFSPSP
jgi:hypothetical protein